jgi:glutathione-regulated potassium-efflux system protein KefB
MEGIMGRITLFQVAMLLMAAGFVAPLAKYLRIGSVLGYLLAGIVIGPHVLGVFREVENILHVAEFGVVLLLFVIGLELKPHRLWGMRRAVFGLGGLQVAITAGVLALAMAAAHYGWREAVFVGLALSLSSTALVLQVLKETGELDTRHGRLSFAVLLFQDLAAIPMIALVGLLAAGTEELPRMGYGAALQAIVAIAAIVLAGRYVLDKLYRMVARTGVHEAMTALVLMLIVIIVLIMEAVGLSPALGAFIAGALLADSEYRHDIEANARPFQGLFLGLFFLAIGMSLNLHLLVETPVPVIAAALVLLVVKAVVLFPLGLRSGLKAAGARRFSLALAQGGEFAFVLTAAAVTSGVIASDFASLLNLVVTLSMLATPLLLSAEAVAAARLARPAPEPERRFDEIPDDQGHVIIAGLGRFGQIVARVLAARHIPFTALDGDPEQVAVVRRFGGLVFYGDASRLDILEAAQAGKARALVVCVSDVEVSLAIVAMVRRHYPGLPIFARARDRDHVHRLMDLGVQYIVRETYLSALDLTRRLLIAGGVSEGEARRTVEAFSQSDRDRLYRDYAHRSDEEKLRESALRQAQELAELFARDPGAAEEEPEERRRGG